MNAFLLHQDRDFDDKAAAPGNEQELVKDLELQTLLQAMAGEDKLVLEVARKALLCGAADAQTILHRQSALRDCLDNPQVVRELYALTGEALERKRKVYYGVFARSASSILHGSTGLIEALVDLLRTLRETAESNAGSFRSEAFRRLFATLRSELDEDYLAEVTGHLRELRFRSGVLISARLGEGNKGADYVLRRLRAPRGWLARLVARPPATYSFRIAPRDEGGARALAEIRDEGLNPTANALAQSADHIVGFFTMLRVELAFYVGCLNLHERLTAKGCPVCFPEPAAVGERHHFCRGLYDASLALIVEGEVVGSDLNAEGKDFLFITGANQGGKSTFLRSVGLAQLMMQCGMFVPARQFRANLCRGLFTHYKRREDATMKSGKFDEELSRMSRIVEGIREGSLVLFNESFAATNEREGSEIARQIVSALIDKGVKVFFVTHMYELAHGFHERELGRGLFLRAERRADGTRTYRMVEGEPLQTSHGRDLYDRVFAAEQSLQTQSA